MKRAAQRVLVLAVTALLLVLFARGTSLAEVWRQIVSADWPLLIVALASSSAAYVLRARRWQFLLRPVGRTRFGGALRATILGFAASYVLPGRAGEVLRPYLLARSDGLSGVAAFATIVVERLLDLIGVLVLFAAFLVLVRVDSAVTNAYLFRAVQLGGLAAGGASLAAFVVMVFAARSPERAVHVLWRLASLISKTLADRIVATTTTFFDGLAILRDPWDAAVALAGAFPLWFCTLVSIWCVTHAFHLGVPTSGSVLLLMLLVIGVSVPTPAGVGAVHYAFRLGATAFYAAAEDRAVGAAIVLHALTVVPVIVAGAWLAAAGGLNLQRLRGIAASPINSPVGSS
ncbi:MAG TPA: lysylphosphatidylglycerol synthase transmembrane domain-containing protein [Vicinamibacterales bacterium]